MSLRDTVEALFEEEGNPEDPDVMNKYVCHIILTGLKHNSIKIDLHPDIKVENLSDVPFLEKVALVEANGAERLGKVKTKAEIAALFTRYEFNCCQVADKYLRRYMFKNCQLCIKTSYNSWGYISG